MNIVLQTKMMSTSTNLVLVTALMLWTTVPFSSSFAPSSNNRLHRPSSSRIIVSSADHDDGISSDPRHRDILRFSIASVLSILPFVSWKAHEPAMILPPSAFAIQEKNEVLWYVIFCLILYLIHLLCLHFEYILH